MSPRRLLLLLLVLSAFSGSSGPTAVIKLCVRRQNWGYRKAFVASPAAAAYGGGGISRVERLRKSGSAKGGKSTMFGREKLKQLTITLVPRRIHGKRMMKTSFISIMDIDDDISSEVLGLA